MKSRQTRVLIVLMVIAFGVALAAGQKAKHKTAEDAIRAADQQWLKVFAAKDLEKSVARSFVEAMAREDFAEAVKSFGPPLNGSLPAVELQKTWKAVLTKGGAFQRVIEIQTGRVEEYGGQKYDVVIVRCQLEHAVVDVRMSFDSAARITSLWFVPPGKK